MNRFMVVILLVSLISCGESETSVEDDSIQHEQNPSDNAGQEKTSHNINREKPTRMSQSVNNRAIVFYNVENLFDTINDPLTSDDDFTPNGIKSWNTKRYYSKLNNLSQVFSKITDELPVMIGLAEVENRTVLEDLIKTERMSQKNYAIVHDESPDNRGIDVALLIDQDVFTYDSHESIRVDFPWDRDIKTRDILHVIGHFKDNDKVHIFVNHWPSRRDGVVETEPKRLEVAGKLRDRLNDIFLDEDTPKIIVMGDFNDAPSNKSVQFVLNSLNTELDVAEAGEALKEGQLLNLSYWIEMDLANFGQATGTLVHDNRWEVLDQIMCSKALLSPNQGVYISDYAENFDESWILYQKKDGSFTPNKTYGGKNYYGGYSDHLPIYLILKDTR